MKKLYFTFSISLVFLLISPAVFSQGSLLSKSEAKSIATSYAEKAFSSDTKTSYQASHAASIKESNTTVLYAFNIKDGGYVLVSASKLVLPVLAFSKKGYFDQAALPPAFSMWIDAYKKQIFHAHSNGIKAGPSIWEAWDILENNIQQKDIVQKDVSPLTVSTWNQGVPYNAMCPADPAGAGGHCVTGCVATTIAQLFYYFRFPEQGTGSYTYVHPVYDTISADFSSANYEYDKMLNHASKPNEEMAELSFHPGVAVDMVYGPQGSGMYNHKAAYVMRTFFKMSPQTVYVYRDSTTMDWDSLLVTHLDKRIPLYYAGWSVPNIVGHAYVCDGYQVNTMANYYHFNWGWGGAYDGYFYTDDLTPGGSLFNLAQELVVNGYPDTSLYTYPSYCQGQRVHESLLGTIDDGSGPAHDYQNNMNCSWLIAPMVSPHDSIESITIHFNRLNTEQNIDKVILYAGPDASSPLLGEYSGSTLPAAIVSMSQEVFITFTSDSANQGDGFFISYETGFPEYCDNLTTINDSAGTLSDGSDEKYYTNNTLCRWLLNPPNAVSIVMEFTKFSTEANKDILYIYDYTTSNLIGQYSGDQIPTTISSPGGSVYFEFITNDNTTDDGWEINYHSLNTGIEDHPLFGKLEIFPNPAGNTLYISMPDGINARLSLFSIDGRKVMDKDVDSGINATIQISLEDIENGTYILALETDEGILHHKVIVRK